MTKGKKTEILGILSEEIVKVRNSTKKTQEAAKFKMSGPSQSGDKYHAESAAELSKQYLARLQALKKEIASAKEEVHDKADLLSHVHICYQDGTRLDFVLVNNAISLPGHLFISKDSPLGRAVFGRKKESMFSYTIGDDNKTKYQGKVVEIE